MGKKLMYVSIVLLVLGSAVAASATPGPIGWWKFDETSGEVAVDSVGGLNGVLMPAGTGPAWAAGKIGGAIQLDGTDDYVDLPIGNMVSGLSDTTVTCWVNWGGSGMWARVFDFGSGTGIYMFMCPQANNNRWRFAIRTAAVGEQIVDGPANLPTGWHHVGVNINASAKTITIFQDGGRIPSSRARSMISVSTTGRCRRTKWPMPWWAGSATAWRTPPRRPTKPRTFGASNN
jgi:hypothetical protein